LAAVERLVVCAIGLVGRQIEMLLERNFAVVRFSRLIPPLAL
jgi:hypothetical protein